MCNGTHFCLRHKKKVEIKSVRTQKRERTVGSKEGCVVFLGRAMPMQGEPGALLPCLGERRSVSQ